MYGRKIVFLSSLLLVLFSSGGAFAALSPEVLSVDFYPSGARFVFQLELEKEGDFEFTLPVTFLSESVRALQRGVASLRVDVIQEEVRLDPAPVLEPEERAAMEERLEVLEGAYTEKRREIRLL